MSTQLARIVAINAAILSVIVVSISDNSRYSYIGAVLYFALAVGLLAALLFGRTKRMYMLSMLVPFLAWDIALQNTIPALTRLFTPVIVVFAASIMVTRTRERKSLKYVLFPSGVLFACCVIGVVRYAFDQLSMDLVYSFMMLAGAFMLFVGAIINMGNGRSVTYSLYYSITISIASYMSLNILYFIIINQFNFSNVLFLNTRLGNFSFFGANYVGFVGGVGVMSGLPSVLNYKTSIINGVPRGDYALMLLAWLICLVGVLLSQTFTMFGVVGFVSLLFVFQTSQKVALKATTIVVTCIGLFVLFNVLELFDAVGEMRDIQTLSGRTYAWRLSIEEITKSPLTGIAFGDVFKAMPPIMYISELDGSFNAGILTPHNIFVGTCLYYGLFLGIAFLAISLYMLYLSIILLKADMRFSPAALMYIYAFFSHLFVDMWSVLFFMPMAILIAVLSDVFFGSRESR